MGFLTKAWTITRKDMAAELRNLDALVSMLVFGLLVVLIFNFGIQPGLRDESLVRPGVLWAAFAFAGILGLNRSFGSEREGDCLEALLLCPIDRAVIYVGKFLSNLIFTFVMGMLISLFFVLLYNLDVARTYPPLIAVLLLTAIGFSAVGTLFAAVSAAVRTREITLSVLLLPMLVPLVLAAAKSSLGVLEGEGLSGAGLWLLLLAAYDVIFFTVSILIFEHAVEE